MKRSLFFASVLVVGTMIAVAGCGSTTKSASSYGNQSMPTASAVATTGSSITIENFMFSTASVKAGSTVTVTNKDGVSHTVNVNGTKIDVTVPGGGSATFTAPTKAGTYPLTCDFHHSMHGTLIVQ